MTRTDKKKRRALLLKMDIEDGVFVGVGRRRARTGRDDGTFCRCAVCEQVTFVPAHDLPGVCGRPTCRRALGVNHGKPRRSL